MSPWPQGPYTALEGYIVHGSRSGVDSNDAVTEFWGTARFTKDRTDDLGYQATIGPDLVSLGVPFNQWAWHARGYSPRNIGLELAQSVESHPIDDATVNAMCWFIQLERNYRLSKRLPLCPLVFQTHAEIDGTPEYGPYFDGKTDVFHKGSSDWDDLKSRILARLALIGVT